MTSKNDITGDEIKSKSNSEKYREGWDRIFGNKHKKQIMTIGDYVANIEKAENQPEDPKSNAPVR